jgi:PhzF family phenazine biosynthesis protein
MNDAKILVDLFYPLLEVSFIKEDESGFEIINPFSNLKEDHFFKPKYMTESVVIQENLSTGKSVKSVIIPRTDKDGATDYYRYRFDLSLFQQLHGRLEQIIQQQAPVNVVEQWTHQIDQAIESFCKESKITIEALSSIQKRKLINQLQEKGFFDFKEASTYIASKLKISRASIYNYLKMTTQLKTVEIHQVNAFTDERFSGNPAGVVFDAEQLEEQIMKKIARELNLSETAFIFPSDKADLKLRFFTPSGHELNFCGHSSVGALYMIARERKYAIEGGGTHQFKVETLAGVLNMEVQIEEDEHIQVAYETPKVDLVTSKISHDEIAQAMGISTNAIDRSIPVMYEKTNKDLFVSVKELKDLEDAHLNSKSLLKFSKKHDIVVLAFVSSKTIKKSNQLQMRCFAPLVGISEDPFTGSVLGGLAAYTEQHQLLDEGSRSFRVEQGHFMDRPGEVKVEFSKKKKQYQVKVYAQAVHCFSTKISLT